MKITSALRNKKGFSLIELLVVIAIIAILTAIVTSNFTQSKAKARDAKRVSDIAQIQLALALFFDRCNAYPSTDGESGEVVETMSAPTCPNKSNNEPVALGDYISVIPHPPVGTSETSYGYISDGYDYIISIGLENKGAALDDDIDGSPEINGTSVTCDDVPNFKYCVKPN